MREPYREPEVPSAIDAERRLDVRRAEAKAARAADRERERQRMIRRRRIVLGLMALPFVALAVDLGLWALGVVGWWTAPTLVIGGLGIPITAVLLLGAKIPPRPEDAPPVVSSTRISG